MAIATAEALQIDSSHPPGTVVLEPGALPWHPARCTVDVERYCLDGPVPLVGVFHQRDEQYLYQRIEVRSEHVSIWHYARLLPLLRARLHMTPPGHCRDPRLAEVVCEGGTLAAAHDSVGLIAARVVGSRPDMAREIAALLDAVNSYVEELSERAQRRRLLSARMAPVSLQPV